MDVQVALSDGDDEGVLTPGDALGPWVVARRLGAGGTATVYEAAHASLGRRAALKVLHPRHAFRREMRARFLREGRAAARIRHPHVVEVYDVGVEGDRAWMVMPLLEGESLADLLRRDAPIAPRRAADLLLPVLAALDAVHAAGVVHRDVKPGNVHVARVSEREHPTLLDFGAAHLDDPGVDLATRSQSLHGTPAFMSPEQARGARDLDARSDVFSAGVVLYQCLTGALPFAGETWQATLMAVASCAFAPPRALRPELAPSLEAVTLRAMAKDPAARFASARAMGDAIAPFASPERAAWWRAQRGDAQGDAPDETPVELSVRGDPPARRPWRSLAVLASAAVLAVAGLARSVHGQRPTARAPTVMTSAPSPHVPPSSPAPATPVITPSAAIVTPTPLAPARRRARRPSPHRAAPAQVGVGDHGAPIFTH